MFTSVTHEGKIFSVSQSVKYIVAYCLPENVLYF